MAEKWFFTRDGQQYGPLTALELKKFAKDGRLLPTDLLWKEGMPTWVPASSAKGLFVSPPPMETVGLPTVTDAPSVATAQPTQSKDRLVAAAVGFKRRAAEAARCAQATAERTQLVNVTLPRAYAELGRVVFKDSTRRTEFAELITQIENLLSQRSQIEQECKARPAGSTLAAKAKKAVADAAALATTKAVDIQVYHAYSKLGEAVYQRLGNDAGPTAVTQPISMAVAKRDQLDEELSAMASAAQDRWLTPKRIAVATVGLAALAIASVGLKLVSSDDSGFRNRLMGEWRSDSGLTLTFEKGSVVASGQGGSFKASYTMRPASRQVFFKLNVGPEPRSFAGTLEADSLQLESSDKAGEVLTFTRASKPMQSGGSDDDLTPNGKSEFYQNGYHAGKVVAGNFRQALASATSDAERAGTLRHMNEVRAGFQNALATTRREYQNRQDLIDLETGKLDGFTDELGATPDR